MSTKGDEAGILPLWVVSQYAGLILRRATYFALELKMFALQLARISLDGNRRNHLLRSPDCGTRSVLGCVVGIIARREHVIMRNEGMGATYGISRTSGGATGGEKRAFMPADFEDLECESTREKAVHKRYVLIIESRQQTPFGRTGDPSIVQRSGHSKTSSRTQ